MTNEHDRLDATFASLRQAHGSAQDATLDAELTRRSPEEGDLLDRQLVKRALFPRRADPVRIGRFTVLGLVGRGAMGVVYACYDDLLDRKVAVKVLRGEVTRESAAVLMQREAQALARLNHPNVVAVHDVGTLGERMYLAMEFVDGQTLGAWLKATATGLARGPAVILAAARGLAAAHEKGLVHRDIKPDNIMVGADGRVRVMDFGLARRDTADADARPPLTPGVTPAHDALAARLTRTGALTGTPAYMASEQFLGESTDARTDQFSLCATAWEALYGQPAFAGDTLLPLASNVTSGALTPPPAGSKVPAWLRRVLERGLRPNREDRHPDTHALLQALRADPTRRRRAAGIITSAVVVLLTAYGARAAVQRQAVAACEAEGAAIDGDWNDDTRAALERSFLATGKAYAATTYARTVPWFDRWAGSWRAAAVAGCRAHTIEQTWDADLRARSQDCLEEARGSFTALVRELGDADDTGLARATSAAAGLAGVEACTRPDALRQRPMTQPEQHGEVMAVRARLAQAASLEAAGRYKDGLEIATATLTAARAIGWAPVVAQAELRVAALTERSGDYAGAEASLLRALAAAREARSPGLALTGATELVYLVGYRGSRHAEGKVWAESARLQLALLPGEHPLELADLHNHLAGVEYVTGDYDESARLYTEALALREGALGDGHPRVADSLNNLASARFAKGEHDESARLYLRALALFEQALGPDHPQVATTLGNLALVHQSTGAYGEAIALLTRALAIRGAALGEDHPQLASGFSNLALVHEAMGDNDEAARLLLKALALNERAFGADHPQVADCVHNLATVRFATGDHDEAARLFTRALTFYEQVDRDHPMTATSLSGLAQIHYVRGQYDEALRLYTRALAVIEAALGPEHPSAAHVLNGLGETHTAMGRPAVAVPLLERALAIRAASSVQSEELAESRFALARALGPAQAQRARVLAEQALQAYAAAVGSERERTEVRAWLASHAPPTRP
jgi:tetratricopeptide (TPR) repeat protein/predicted Ser/Thr protein kinase